MNLIALQMKTTEDFKNNLEKLEELIKQCPENSIISTPELALCGFAYKNMKEASDFSQIAIPKIQALSQNKIIVTTLIIEEEGKFYNTLYMFYNEKIVHTQSKTVLFALGDETVYFTASQNKIKIIEINGLKIASLICFELRFPKLWEEIKGADIIINPAMWGIKRKDHYESISKALALVNQAFVIACNSSNDNMAKGSAIISPFGNIVKNDEKEIITSKFDRDEIVKTRRYIDIGLK